MNTLLAIDIGNSHTVIGLYQADELTRVWRLRSDPQRTADEYQVIVEGLFSAHGLRPDAVQGAVIASVVEALTEVFASVCRRITREPLVVTHATDTGVCIRYESPAELGADRIVNAAGAFERYRRSLIIIDFGTATTYDYVSAAGEFCGGAIAPGVAAAAEALFQRASKLPRVDLSCPGRVIATGTADGMRSGIIYGYAGQVDGMVERMRREAHDHAGVIATGGLARAIAPHCAAIDAVDEHLTLYGLKIIFDRQPKKG